MNIRVLKAVLVVLVLSSLHFSQAVAQTNSGTPPVVDVPMLFRGPMPAVEVMVNGQGPFLFEIDTGGAGMARVDSSLVERLKLAAPPVVVGKARTVSSEVEIKEARLKESIRLGRFEYAEPTVVFPALSEDANIGSKVLREFALTFDQKNGRVALKRQETLKSRP